jgi:nitrite reductase/ring-hydroxylating ferredoxin subunit
MQPISGGEPVTPGAEAEQVSGTGSRHRVCDPDDLAIGEMRLVKAAGKPVLLVRSADGRYHAVRHLCSHQGVDMSTGVLTGRMCSSSVGSYELVEDYEIVRCPRHGYQFDVTTGRALLDPHARIKVYVVIVERDGVYVSL